MQQSEYPDGDHTPRYNVKAVVSQVGIAAVTLRAWERRYGLPSPGRGENGYRLYSEHDVRTLRWLKAQTTAGLSIGRAADHLQQLRAAGRDPAQASQAAPDRPATPADLASQCLEGFLALDERRASNTLQLAFALYPLDRVLFEVAQPALVALGERWHRGALPVAVEHFATQFCLRRLMSLAAAAGEPTRPGVIVAAAAPGEYHEIGLLMIVVCLRWRGWDVKYLGPNLSLDRLEEAVGPLRPRLLLFTANRPEAAAALRALPPVLERFPSPRPQVILGGQAFETPEDHGHWPGLVLNGEPSRIVETVEALMLGANVGTARKNDPWQQ